VIQRPPQRAAPGLAVAGLFVCFSLVILLPVPRVSNVGLLYLTGAVGAESDFFYSLLMSLSGVCIAYTVVTEHDLSRYTLTTVGLLLLMTEVRYGIDSFDQVVSVLVGLCLTSVLLAAVAERDADDSESLFELPPTGLFQLAALTAYGLLAAGLAAVVVSVTFFDTSPLLVGHGSTAAVERLLGDEAAHGEASQQFHAVVAATLFLAVFTDATRHAEVGWLTLLALVVDFAATGLLIAQTHWNATVAAVGTLLTVTLVGTVLYRRYHVSLPTRPIHRTFK